MLIIILIYGLCSTSQFEITYHPAGYEASNARVAEELGLVGGDPARDEQPAAEARHEWRCLKPRQRQSLHKRVQFREWREAQGLENDTSWEAFTSGPWMQLCRARRNRRHRIARPRDHRVEGNGTCVFAMS